MTKEKFEPGDKVKFKPARKVPYFVTCIVQGYTEDGRVLTKWADDGTITREQEKHLILYKGANEL